MAYEITRQIRASTSCLAGLENSEGFRVLASGRKSAVLAAIQDADITPKEGEIITHMLDETPWPPLMLTELRTALASRIDARVTSRTQAHQFQDFTNIVHYYPAEVWRSEDSLIERLATVLDLPCGLGLQISSETTVQVITAAYLCVSEGCMKRQQTNVRTTNSLH